MWFLIFLISFGILLVFIELLILPGFGAAGIPGALLVLIGFRCRMGAIRLADRANCYRNNAGTGHSLGDHRAVLVAENVCR